MISPNLNNVSIDFNTEEFTAGLRKYAAQSEKALPRVMNQKMFYIGANAARLTPKTTRAQIEQEMNVVGYNLEIGKRGKALNRRRQGGAKNAIYGGNRMFRIINARMGRANKKGLYGPAMKAAADKFLANRFRSVGTLKAGWTHALRKLGSVLGFTFQNEGASKTVMGKSSAVIARDGWNPTASITYNTNSFSADHRAYIDRRIFQALSKSYQRELQFMAKDVKKVLEPKQMGKAAAMAEIQRVTRGGA
jgi:hypothetical protein